MTKEELWKEAEDYANNLLFVYETDIVQRIVRERVKLALIDVLEPREKEIKSLGERCLQLQKDKGELTDKVNELEAQIEKMKCCGNCENGELSAHEEPCLHCQRCFASTDVTDQENVKDYWEAIKEIK